MIENRSD